jgi:hypothetical protein
MDERRFNWPRLWIGLGIVAVIIFVVVSLAGRELQVEHARALRAAGIAATNPPPWPSTTDYLFGLTIISIIVTVTLTGAVRSLNEMKRKTEEQLLELAQLFGRLRRSNGGGN